MKARVWTGDEERELMRLETQGVTYKEIGERLGRSIDAIDQRLKRLRSRGVHTAAKPINHWTEEQEETLRKMAAMGASIETMVLTIGRTRQALYDKATRLEIKLLSDGRMPPLPLPPTAQRILDEMGA